MNLNNNFSKLIIGVAVVVLVVIGFVYMTPPASTNTAIEVSTVTSPQNTTNKTLLFFLNPNGRPCQQQIRILDQNKAEIRKYASIQYIDATDRNNQEMFYRFGIRALPSMVVIDNNANILHRFAPGIQASEQLLKVLSTQN